MAKGVIYSKGGVDCASGYIHSDRGININLSNSSNCGCGCESDLFTYSNSSAARKPHHRIHHHHHHRQYHKAELDIIMGDVFYGNDDHEEMNDYMYKEDVVESMRSEQRHKALRRRQKNKNKYCRSLFQCFEFLWVLLQCGGRRGRTTN